MIKYLSIYYPEGHMTIYPESFIARTNTRDLKILLKTICSSDHCESPNSNWMSCLEAMGELNYAVDLQTEKLKKRIEILQHPYPDETATGRINRKFRRQEASKALRRLPGMRKMIEQQIEKYT